MMWMYRNLEGPGGRSLRIINSIASELLLLLDVMVQSPVIELHVVQRSDQIRSSRDGIECDGWVGRVQ